MTKLELFNLESTIPPYNPTEYQFKPFPYGFRLRLFSHVDAKPYQGLTFEIRFRKLSKMLSYLNGISFDSVCSVVLVVPNPDPMFDGVPEYKSIPITLIHSLLDPTLF
ncbi:hypothetical protein [Dipodfec virus UOA04_Rod_975]|nr:hypothetical protein [Dipodfec virus UOA04_Rod_975]